MRTRTAHLTEDLGGTRLAQLPKHVATLWNRYDFTPAFGVGLGVIYQTDMFAAADNLVELPGFTRVDAGVYYTPNERLRLQLNVENLFDERYYPNAHNNNNITPGSPPAVRASVTAQLLRSLMRTAREQDYTPGSWGCGFPGDEGVDRAAVRVRDPAAFRLRLVAAHRVFDRHAAAGAGERRASGRRGRAGPVSRDLLRRARRPRSRTA